MSATTTKRTTNASPVAIAYRRWSSKKQATGNSEQRQTEGFDRYLERSELPRGPEYWDKGRSGWSGRHRAGDFGRLLEDCRAGEFPSGSVVWIEDMDRFGRQDLATVLADWKVITSAGYRIHVSGLSQTFDRHTEQMQLMGVICKAIVSHEESNKKSGRLKEAWADKRQKGADARTKAKRLSEACPEWISVSEDGQSYNLNDFAKTVYSACILASQDGQGQKAVSKATGIKANALTRIFRSRTLVGEYQPCTRGSGRKAVGAPVANYYPAVLTMDEFRRLQDSIARRRTAKAKRTVRCADLLSGLCFTPDNVRLIQKESYGPVRQDGTRLRKFWLYRYVDGQTVPGGGVRYEVVEFGLINWVLALTSADLQPKDKGAERKALDEVRATIADKMKTVDSLSALLTGANADFFGKRIDALLTEVKALEGQAEALEAKASVAKADHLGQAQAIGLHLRNLTDPAELLEARFKLKELLANIVKRVVVEVLSPREAVLTVELTNGEVLPSWEVASLE